MNLLDIPAILLVGGMGTRLRSVVPTAPKPLAAVGGAAFLELLVRQLRCQGIRQLVMCTGYRAEQIEEEFADGHAWDVQIRYSKELEPLGTAGAVRLAAPYVREASEFVVMNGDSFLDLDFGRLVRFHRSHGGIATIAVFRVEETNRYGTVETDAGSRVTGFLEKTGERRSGPGQRGRLRLRCFNSRTHSGRARQSRERCISAAARSGSVCVRTRRGVHRHRDPGRLCAGTIALRPPVFSGREWPVRGA